MLLVEAGFLGANIPKIPKGGWFALVVAIVLMVQMQTWRRGRQLVAARIRRGERPISDLLDSLHDVQMVHGVGVFLFKDLGKSPPALVNNLRHNKVLHHTTLIVSVDTSEEPRIPEEARMSVVKYESPTELEAVRRALPLDDEPGVYQVSLTFGFMEDPDVPAALERLNEQGIAFDPDDVTYFIGHESIISGKAPGMHPLLEQLFVLLNRGADSAVRFFNLPPDQVFEVGSRVEI
jgi:KUP system potassium uptake protein